ncbi:SDR family oxidoreductase [Streptomyces sp. NPDC003952]
MPSPKAPRVPDPVTRHPRPPFPEQEQDHPGSTEEMPPRPDHGEDSYQGHDVLLDQVVLVTGGDSGIGRAVCLAFAREGADIAFTHLPEEADEAAETARLVGDAGRRAVPVLCDIRDEARCEALITTEQFDRVMKTNLYGMFWLSRAALAHIPRGGSIINTASVQGYQPLGRAAQPAEMAPAYVFLASPQASYITGEIVNATGGTPLP